jgi:RimJ/RimL family protein N-acetyltransferase
MNDRDDLLRDPWEGDGVRLRALTLDDWELFLRWNAEPDWSWTGPRSYPPSSPEHVRRWVEREVNDPRGGDVLRLVIVRTDNGVAAGTIDTNDCNRQAGTFRYALAVGQEHREHGFAREAAVIMARYYFRELGYQKLNTSVYEFNEPSLALQASLGMVLEGRMRRMVYRGRRHWDELLFGITREEFEDLHPLQ